MRAGISPDEFHRSTLREVWVRISAASWRQERQARLAVMGASLMAKLVRAKPQDYRRAVAAISRTLKKPIGPLERQDPETQRALFLDWAATLGLKVERHERPVI